MSTTPRWLYAPEIQHLLNHLVDRLDAAQAAGRTRIQSVKLDARSFPALYKADFEESREHLWGQLESLAAQGWFSLRLAKATPGTAAYEREPRIEILDASSIRAATGRITRAKTASERWREAVRAGLLGDDALKEAVSAQRLEVPGKSEAEVVERLNRLQEMGPDTPLLLREVSAKIFWGLSKVLDRRQALVARLLNVPECPFPEMPIQLLTALPSWHPRGVLFIENQATFERATQEGDNRFDELALVFASGFMGSAARLRKPGGASLYFSRTGSLDATRVSEFEQWLLGGRSVPVWFWGDLDFAGMRILAALRGSFPELQGWVPGYAPMLEALESGDGHPPDAAGKQRQQDISATGCAYADEVLLPAIRRAGRFVDQESF